MSDDRHKLSGDPGSRGYAAGSIEVVKRVFAAFERRDLEAAIALFHPDARFFSVTAEMVRDGRPYEGLAGIREYFRDIERVWDEIEPRPLQFEAVVDAVVAIGEVRARGPAGELREPAIWSFKLRDGLVVEARVHSDPASARRALGDAPAETHAHVRIPG